MGTKYIATTGNDTTGDGSSGNPWLTLEKADASATSGDTISIADGTYDEVPYLDATKELAWVAENAGSVTVTSDDATHLVALQGTTTKSFSGIIFDGEDATQNVVRSVTGSENATFTNCTFKGANKATTAYHFLGSGAGDNINFNSCTFSGAVRSELFKVDALTNVTIDSCTFISTSTAVDVIKLTAVTGTFTFTNNTGTISITATGKALINHTNDADIVLSNNTMTFDNLIRAFVYLVTAGKVGSLVADGNNFTYSLFNAGGFYIIGGTHDIQISNNILLSTGTQANAVIFCRGQPGAKVYGNTIDTRSSTNSGIRHIRVDSSGATAAHNPYVADNICKSYSTGSSYLILIGSNDQGGTDELLNNAIVENNTIYSAAFYGQTESGCHGIIIGYQLYGTVRGNKVYGASSGIVIKGGNGAGTAQDYAGLGGVFGNLVVDCNFSAGIRVKGLTNAVVANNTLINTAAVVPNGLLYVSVGDDAEAATGTVIKNNIFKADNDYNMIHIDASSTGSTSSDYNQYYRTGTAIRVKYGVADYTTLAALRTGESDDVSSTNIDITFNADYSIPSDSALIGTGVKTWGLQARPTSLSGEPYPDRGIDIGGYQTTNYTYHPANL